MKDHRFVTLILMLVCTIPFASSQPPFLQEETTDTSLYFLYPKTEAFPVGSTLELHFHVFDQNLSIITGSSNLTCNIHIYNQTHNHLIKTTLVEDGVGFLYSFPGNNTMTEGVYSYNLWCNSSSRHGFGRGILSDGYYITSNGKFYGEGGDTFLPIALLLAASVFAILFVAHNWDAKIYSEKSDAKHSIVKMVINLIVLWAIPVLIQAASNIATLGRMPTTVTALTDALYFSSMFTAVTVSIVALILIFLNMMMWLGVDVIKTVKGGKR